MKKLKLKFVKHDDDAFYQSLRKEVYNYFHSRNLSMYANKHMLVKTIFFFVLFFITYLLILFGGVTNSMKIVLCFFHGIAITGIGFNISHDSSHNAYFRKNKYNRLLSYSMDLVGSNSYMWDIKHNKSHHIYTNIQSFDEDITGSYLLRLSPHAPLHKVNRLQHVYAFPLYTLIYFYIVWIYNFVQFKAQRFGAFNQIKHSSTEWIKLIGWKLFYVLYAVAVPFFWLKLSLLEFLIGYGTVCATSGFLLGITFYLAHCVDNCIEFPLPEKQEIKNSWVRHQMETTSNFAVGNKFITWFCGGLNYQVEHHLFPEICSIHYSKISKIVEKVSKEYNIPYKYYNGVGHAVKAHYNMLKKLSSPTFK